MNPDEVGEWARCKLADNTRERHVIAAIMTVMLRRRVDEPSDRAAQAHQTADLVAVPLALALIRLKEIGKQRLKKIK